MCEGSVEFGGELDFVDVVLRKGLVDADGETGPDDIVGVDGRNKECGFRGLDVVDESAVGEVAAGEVVEVSALTGGSKIRSCFGDKVGYAPEGLGLVAIFHHSSNLTLKV